MSATQSPHGFTAARKAGFYLTLFLLFGVLFVAMAEVVLRTTGVKPWRAPDLFLQVEPGGKIVKKHPTLSYARIPGRFTVTLRSGYSFNFTIAPDALRITRPIEIYKGSDQKEDIWIFGCSYTEGWTVNDHETFPWLLQDRFPEYDVVNFGTGGYGTVQSLLQFREALETTKPKIVVLAYAAFHDDRNTFSRKHRSNVARWNRLGPLVHPYARLDEEDNLQLDHGDVVYSEFPMIRYLALANFIDMNYNQLESGLLRGHAVSKALIVEMEELATKHGAKFVVANISSKQKHLADKVLHFAETRGIPNVDISVNEHLSENTNLPHDAHPSAFAHRQYADTLERSLRTGLLE